MAPQRNFLVLFLALLALGVFEVAPASAAVGLDLAVVRGTDNGVYWNSYTSIPSWGSWASLAGSTLSAPGICESSKDVYVVVRGTDNGIYFNAWTGSWSGWSSLPSGSTIDQPACAILGGTIYVVVRGTGGELYWTSEVLGTFPNWSAWQDLHGQSASAPVLVASTFPFIYSPRIDLVIQGTDNGIYHKSFTSGVWSSSWDSPGGSTSSKPGAARFTTISACSTPPCPETDFLLVVVRGTDNNIYSNSYEMEPETVWGTWSSLNGQTLSAPTLAYDENNCQSSGTSISACTSIDALAVQGTDNAVYSKTYTGAWSGSWFSPGGSITNSPALAYVPGTSGISTEFLLLVQGNPSNTLYSNTAAISWGAYSSLGGATNSAPALVALV